ncbi:MAG: UDP-N-acetylmuramate--L-alanine ligase [Bacteroidetes bacterium]|nr:UDP-N-acetylmuramate--L-alanine ligase [Bacteroidota bacterium]
MNHPTGKPITQVYFLGIGGIGMSALARYFLSSGMKVAGYDRSSTPLTDELRKEGMEIHFEDAIENIPSSFKASAQREQTLIVLTPAIPAQHHELNFFREQGYQIAKRSQVLGLITNDVKTFAVAGTHGKTTTSSILTHILYKAERNCTAFLGGISTNYNSNLLLGDASKPNHEIVVEADEFDRSFLTLFPYAAIITSMDADHLDIYGNAEEMQHTYRLFAGQVKAEGFIVHKSGLDLGSTPAKKYTYSIRDKHADYVGANIKVEQGRYRFDLVTPGYVIEGLTLGLPGRHNIENAVAACAIALEEGVDMVSLKEALETYSGVQRRFQYHVVKSDIVYIDDYAHHPEELRAAILSARELFPTRKITVAFQPHLFSRTRDFMEGFAESLSLADALYLLDIYPAREEPIPGIDSDLLFSKIAIDNKYRVSKEEVIQRLRIQRPEVFMTLGAGDIDQLIQPIKTLLEQA